MTIFHEKYSQIDPAADKHVALVISPLITIIEEQTEKLTQTGISAFGVHTGSSQKALQGMYT